MPRNQFQNIGMDHTLVEEAIASAGATELGVKVVRPGAQLHYTGLFDGSRFLINLLINRDGKCTIGYTTGYDRPTFELIAEAISTKCRYSSHRQLEASLHAIESGQVDDMLHYMESENVEIVEESTTAYRMFRLRGRRGDQLVLKYYPNKTLQLQGSHAQVGSLALNHLQTILPIDELLAHQRAVYAIPISVDQLKNDLVARIPAAHDWLHDAIRIQFTSALALTKVGIELEDHAAIAFPAFRGLEGFCYQLLASYVQVAPGARDTLGAYFEDAPSGKRLLSIYREDGSGKVATALAECYMHWQRHRHRLFHMDGTIETTRILEDRTEAVALVDDVLDLVERTHMALST